MSHITITQIPTCPTDRPRPAQAVALTDVIASLDDVAVEGKHVTDQVWIAVGATLGLMDSVYDSLASRERAASAHDKKLRAALTQKLETSLDVPTSMFGKAAKYLGVHLFVMNEAAIQNDPGFRVGCCRPFPQLSLYVPARHLAMCTTTLACPH